MKNPIPIIITITVTFMFLFILLTILTSCISDPEPPPPEPVCTTRSDYCNKSNYDGTEICGYPSLSSCMDKTTVFGFTCYEVLEEVCY